MKRKKVVFVTFTHPDQRFDSQTRTVIARHIGKHYRNRSRPAFRKRLETGAVTVASNTSTFGVTILPVAVGQASSPQEEECAVSRVRGVPAATPGASKRLDHPSDADEVSEALYLPSSPSDKFFDHFRLSSQETNLVTWYLNEIPSAAYGTTGRGLFCPGRDIAWYATMACPEAIQWSLIDAEGYVIANQSPGYDSSLLAQRRTMRKVKAYATLRQMLNDTASVCSDQTLTLVCAAVAIEARFFDRYATRAHVRGLSMLIAKRGGVRSLLNATVTFGHPMAGIGFLLLAELETSGPEETTQVTSRFLKQLIEMQDHLSLLPATQGGFSLHAQIRELLNPKTKLSLLPKQLARFITLYTLNMIVTDCNRNGKGCLDFFRRLNKLIEGSMAVNPTSGSPMVREEILTWIMAKSWADVEALRPCCVSWQSREVQITESAIDALKVWSRLRSVTKQNLLQALYSWLFLSNSEHPERLFLNQADLDWIRRDATSSYYEECVSDVVLSD